MDNFNFYSPTEFVFGKGRENESGKYVRKYGGSRVLVHYGSHSAVASGLIDRIKASLDAEGVYHVELGGVQANPRDTLVYKGIELCKKENIDFINKNPFGCHRRKPTALGQWEEPCEFVTINLGFQCTFVW